MASDTEELPRCSLCGGQHDVRNCPKQDISGGSSVFVFKPRCEICGGEHETRKCDRKDISGGSSVFVYKKCPTCGGQHALDSACPPPKRRRSTEPVKTPAAQAKQPRAQPTPKLVTTKPARDAKPPAKTDASRAATPPTMQGPPTKQTPLVEGGPTPSKADDCTLTLEGAARVTAIGADGKLMVKTAAGTVELPQPCRDTIIQSKPNSP